MPPIARLPLLIMGVFALIIGVLAGLARLSLTMPEFAAVQAGHHGALMVAAFLGTVISLERAVAIGKTWAYVAPLCAGLGGLALLFHMPLPLAQGLMILAASVLSFASLSLLRRQLALYLATLAIAALCWLTGNLTWWLGGSIATATPWWMSFLVLTIAGERLELTRYLPTTHLAQTSFGLIMAVQLCGLLLAFWQESSGLLLFAGSLLLLALWLLRFDIARRTVKQDGLTRFIALCLLAGYGWLLLAGLLGLAGGFLSSAAGSPLRDAALHSVFLGFVFSMIFGHAPVIFPAVARIRINYHPLFYLPFIVLHLSLLGRLLGDLVWPEIPQIRSHSALANGIALALFIATILHAVSTSRSPRKKDKP